MINFTFLLLSSSTISTQFLIRIHNLSILTILYTGLVSPYPLQAKQNPPRRHLTPGSLSSPTNSNASNTSSLLYHALHSLPSPSNAVNWCGFYVLDPFDAGQLILGPFQGHVACQTIRLGRGVCGTAAQERRTQLVGDVDAFPGHSESSFLPLSGLFSSSLGFLLL